MWLVADFAVGARGCGKLEPRASLRRAWKRNTAASELRRRKAGVPKSPVVLPNYFPSQTC